jgi:hypothetical protein
VARLQMVGRWTQVIAGVLAWIVFVPLIEVVRVAARRLIPARDVSVPEQRQAASRAPVAPAHPRRAA